MVKKPESPTKTTPKETPQASPETGKEPTSPRARAAPEPVPEPAPEPAPEPVPEPAPEPVPEPASVPPIVGIGASAGGLEAFERFFTNMPLDSGMALVVVQHLDTGHKSILTDLLKRYTRMPVVQVADGVQVEPNHVYVIPPNRDMAILHGALQLIEPIAPRGMRLPIDFFFRSLAQDQQMRAVCVVLSGTGTDGTLGLRAIKEEGGVTMVQDPTTCAYDGMPRSAIGTGLADYILPPEQMPGKLRTYAQRVSAPLIPGDRPLSRQAVDHLEKIFVLLRNQTGHDFSLYKPNTILRRIERRVAVNQLESMARYVRYLQENPMEIETLFKDLLIGVSSFFRDAEAFSTLWDQVIPVLFDGRSADQPVRIWVPGCSTGEEAYSIAMLVREYLNSRKQGLKAQIFATDLDIDAIETARAGSYPESIAADVSAKRLSRFFTKKENHYEVEKTVRDMLVFAVQNVIRDPPFSKVDLISCRNLLIYMSGELQKRLIHIFHYALRENGYLLLGSSETIGEAGDLFAVINRKWKIFQRKGRVLAERPGAAMMAPRLPLPARETGEPLEGLLERKLSLRELAEQALLKRYAPACVVIDDRWEVLYIHGRTGRFLEPPRGEASLNIQAMARSGLQLELGGALRKATTQRAEIRTDGVRVKTNDHVEVINLVVKPLLNAPNRKGLLLVFFEEARPPDTALGKQAESSEDQDVRELARELQSTKEYLQTTIEELETSNEELKSSNEELQSSNEELQSTNEELETSKEELQSVNEELVTVNSEYELKLEELGRLNNDMVNLLSSTDIGTIFLDINLGITRFTPSATKVVNLIQTDIGRPLGHLVTKLVYDRLVGDVREVLDTLVSKEKEVETQDGRWFLMRIAPYRTTENVIDGVVLTFVDITERRLLDRLATVVRDSNDAITVLDFDGNILAWNRGAEKIYGWREAEALTMNINDLMPVEQRKQAEAMLVRLRVEKAVDSCGTQRLTKDGRRLEIWLTATRIQVSSDDQPLVATTERDITQERQASQRLGRLSEVLLDAPDGIVLTDLAGRIEESNRAMERLYDWTAEELKGRPAKVLGPPARPGEMDSLLAECRQDRPVREVPLLGKKRSGETLALSLSVSLLHDASGEPSGFALFLRDRGKPEPGVGPHSVTSEDQHAG